MAPKKRKAAGVGGSPEQLHCQSPTKGTSGSHRPLVASEHWHFECCACGGKLDVDRKASQYDGRPIMLYHCWACGAGAKEISSATGISLSRLLDSDLPPPDELGPPVGRSRSAANGEPEKLP